MSSESPTGYNAAADLIGRNLDAGRGAKTAFIDDRGRSKAEFAQIVTGALRFFTDTGNLAWRVQVPSDEAERALARAPRLLARRLRYRDGGDNRAAAASFRIQAPEGQPCCIGRRHKCPGLG